MPTRRSRPRSRSSGGRCSRALPVAAARHCRCRSSRPAALEAGLAERLGLPRELRAGRRHARSRQGRPAASTTRLPRSGSTARRFTVTVDGELIEPDAGHRAAARPALLAVLMRRRSSCCSPTRARRRAATRTRPGSRRRVRDGLRADDVPAFMRGAAAHASAFSEAALTAAAVPRRSTLGAARASTPRRVGAHAEPRRCASPSRQLGRGLLRTGCAVFPATRVAGGYRRAQRCDAAAGRARRRRARRRALTPEAAPRSSRSTTTPRPSRPPPSSCCRSTRRSRPAGSRARRRARRRSRREPRPRSELPSTCDAAARAALARPRNQPTEALCQLRRPRDCGSASADRSEPARAR